MESSGRNMAKTLRHRGPDDSGISVLENGVLAHQRLSFFDLSSAGRQPMWDKEGSVAVVLNGEIYNFKEIRKELSGTNFVSVTDTETIIYAYKKWGLEETLKKLNGMFSFALYDKKNNKLYCARDRVGIKPLVYYWNNNNFIFASEIKAILEANGVEPEINEKGVLDFFVYRYVANPRTIYKNIYKLEPGHFLELDINRFSLNKYQYWSLPANGNGIGKEEDIVEQVDTILKDAVSLRMRSDVEIGTFLSGGVDSSLITAFAKIHNPDIHAFTIDLQPSQYSEAEYARAAAEYLGVKLHTKKVGKKEFQESFEGIINILDEPFADSSTVPTYILSQFAKESGVKGVLSGDGGDEIFYGYKWYRTFNHLKKIPDLHYLPESFLVFLSKFIMPSFIKFTAYKNSFEKYRRIMLNRFTVQEVNNLFNYNFSEDNSYLYEEKMDAERLNSEDLNRLDFHTFLVDDILHKVDISSMANSLEVRVPMLDHRLIELMFSVAFDLTYKNNKLKYILNKVAEKYLASETISRPKKGFSAPVMKWVEKNYYTELLKGSLVGDGFVNSENIRHILENSQDEGKVWQIYMFEMWYRNFIKK